MLLCGNPPHPTSNVRCLVFCEVPPLSNPEVSYPRNFLGQVSNVGYTDSSPKRVKPFRLIITAMQICRTG